MKPNFCRTICLDFRKFTSSKNFDSSQPAQSAQADMNRYYLQTYLTHFSNDTDHTQGIGLDICDALYTEKTIVTIIMDP